MEQAKEGSLQTTTNPAKGLVVYILLFLIAWTIRATVLFPIDQSISSPGLGQIYADMLRVFIWIIPVFLYLARLDKTSPVAYLRLNTFGNQKAIFPAGIVVSLYFVIILLVDFARAEYPSKIMFSPYLLSNSWIKTILVLTVAPIAEEIVYRGFFLQKLEAFVSKWKGNLITSFLFVAIHLPNWLYTGKAPLEIITVSVGIFTLSLLLGYLMQKTESLWPSILVHMLNNAISFYLHFG